MRIMHHYSNVWREYLSTRVDEFNKQITGEALEFATKTWPAALPEYNAFPEELVMAWANDILDWIEAEGLDRNSVLGRAIDFTDNQIVFLQCLIRSGYFDNQEE